MLSLRPKRGLPSARSWIKYALQQGGKGSGSASQGDPLGQGRGMASPSLRKPSPKSDATRGRALKSGRKGRWRVSHRFGRKLRSPVPVPSPKSPPPPQKARPRSPPVKVPPQAHVSGPPHGALQWWEKPVEIFRVQGLRHGRLFPHGKWHSWARNARVPSLWS